MDQSNWKKSTQACSVSIVCQFFVDCRIMLGRDYLTLNSLSLSLSLSLSCFEFCIILVLIMPRSGITCFQIISPMFRNFHQILENIGIHLGFHIHIQSFVQGTFNKIKTQHKFLKFGNIRNILTHLLIL